MVVLSVFAGLGLLELCLYTPLVWRVRRPLAAGLMIAAMGVSGLLLARMPLTIGLLLLLISLYRSFNLLRLVENRLQSSYLHRVALRSSLHFLCYQLIVVALWWFDERVMPSAHAYWLALSGAQLVLSLVLLITTRRQIRRLQAPQIAAAMADRDLPSISVCVPARNETAALERCLQALVASRYPKLEILVLDDCSQDKTSEVIRSFAQAGVRFLKGSEPPANWLAKNWAYQQLAAAASGKILVFAGVDIQFAPDSLRNLVTSMLASQQQMVCLLPQNRLHAGLGSYLAALLQPMRYAWELSVPRSMNHPPVLSSCWAIEKQTLQRAGGFAAVMKSITPESHFACATAAANAYSFWVANEEIQVISDKEVGEQYSTALRTRYPQLHRRPELVFLTSLLQLGLLIGTLPLIVLALSQKWWIAAMFTGLAYVLQALAYTKALSLTYHRKLNRGWLFVLPAIILDLYLRNSSMWRYEFGEILWKGRNVCL